MKVIIRYLHIKSDKMWVNCIAIIIIKRGRSLVTRTTQVKSPPKCQTDEGDKTPLLTRIASIDIWM